MRVGTIALIALGGSCGCAPGLIDTQVPLEDRVARRRLPGDSSAHVTVFDGDGIHRFFVFPGEHGPRLRELLRQLDGSLTWDVARVRCPDLEPQMIPNDGNADSIRLHPECIVRLSVRPRPVTDTTYVCLGNGAGFLLLGASEDDERASLGRYGEFPAAFRLKSVGSAGVCEARRHRSEVPRHEGSWVVAQAVPNFAACGELVAPFATNDYQDALHSVTRRNSNASHVFLRIPWDSALEDPSIEVGPLADTWGRRATYVALPQILDGTSCESWQVTHTQ